MKERGFSTPFVITSTPRLVSKRAGHLQVWPEEIAGHAMIEFGISPLGTPSRWLSVDDAKTKLPSLIGVGNSWDKKIHVAPIMVFVPSQITVGDWAVLMDELADKVGV